MSKSHKKLHPNSAELMGYCEKILGSQKHELEVHPSGMARWYTRKANGLRLLGDDRVFGIAEDSRKKGIIKREFVPFSLGLVASKGLSNGMRREEFYYSPESDVLAYAFNFLPSDETFDETQARQKQKIAHIFSPNSLASEDQRIEFTDLMRNFGNIGLRQDLTSPPPGIQERTAS